MTGDGYPNTRNYKNIQRSQIIVSITILIEEMPKLNVYKIQLHLINQNISK